LYVVLFRERREITPETFQCGVVESVLEFVDEKDAAGHLKET
jgi:hypothetical protein